MSKNVVGPKSVWFKKIWDQNDFGPKKFWVQINLEFKEIWVHNICLKMELSLKNFAQRFLIKTKFDKVFSPERFRSREVGSKK